MNPCRRVLRRISPFESWLEGVSDNRGFSLSSDSVVISKARSFCFQFISKCFFDKNVTEDYYFTKLKQ